MTYTPMIRQYLAIKAQYQDAFLFFRLGDFYEMFFDDAVKASKELEIALTARNGGTDEKIPMCGVPYHAVKQYIKVLIEKGYKIAICEQMEDPKLAKGMVKREVIQMITPGTIMEDDSLEPKKNNYLAALSRFTDGTFGLAVSDLTTGETKVAFIPAWDGVLQEMDAYGVREVVIDASFDREKKEELTGRFGITLSENDDDRMPESLGRIAGGIEQDKLVRPLGRLLNYLVATQKRSLDHLQPAEVYHVQSFMNIDPHSRRNLELTQTIRDKKTYGSLLWLLDETKTAMGGRKLKQWIEKPLLNQAEIERRLSAVEALMSHYFERETLRSALDEVYDLERLVGRVSFGNVNPREVLQLKRSLEQVPTLKAVLAQIPNEELRRYGTAMDPCDDVKALIEQAITDDPPFSTADGGIIKEGYNETLDRYRDAAKNGKRWIADLERQERQATGIKSLKVGFNKVFGYYIEVTKANLKLLPEGRYERRQTLANAERYITPELKEKEQMILEAEEKRVGLEYQLFSEVRTRIKSQAARLQTLARLVSGLDVLQSFAAVSDENRYVKPSFSKTRKLSIKDSRHPVIERVLKDRSFVANDIQMGESCDLLLITGPNMGGKSTYMRQAALTAIMAQIGCFVPASSAELPIFDQIFTRIGAADDLVSGQSTFMVEMLEAQYALSHATQSSLILLDEIGRGTSTYDGIAIAQAIVEYIHNRIYAKTLFSTHYHELTFLEEELPHLKNVHVGAMEEGGKVVFLHKVLDGQADKSYGIHVADLAGLPADLIKRAAAILTELETDSGKDDRAEPRSAAAESAAAFVATASSGEETVETNPETDRSANEAADENEQLAFFAEPVHQSKPLGRHERKVIQTLSGLDLLTMTPMEAMNQLFSLQKALKNKK